jgi:tetratricopeptide (TPR) repeat protein
MKQRRLLLAVPLLALACSTPPDPTPRPEDWQLLPEGAQAFSLFGEPLYPPPLTEEQVVKREAELDQALRERFEVTSDGMVWIGRRLAYLGLFGDAVLVYLAGAAAYPFDARFPRHLGHRWITIRRFADAEKDLAWAAELVQGEPDVIEPDGQPNEAGIPLTTLQSNIHYHLGLARYLMGDFEGALTAYQDYRAVNDDDDGEVAIDHWHYMALRRLGRDEAAEQVLADVDADMTILENGAYHRLCLAYKGELDMDELWSEARAGGPSTIDFSTIGYGAGNWHFYNGRRDEAVRIWREVLTSEQWHAFGTIAAEAELFRLGEAPRQDG